MSVSPPRKAMTTALTASDDQNDNEIPMNCEPQTPTQPRRRQRQEIPWRCVGLEKHKISELKIANKNVHPNRFKESILYSSETLTKYNFCVHVSSLPTCSFHGEYAQQLIKQPVVSTDYFLYEKSNLDEAYENNLTNNPITMEDFEPQTQYWVRLSCEQSLPSKLDPRKKFDKNNPLIGFFSSRSRENCYLIIIEKQDTHGCGGLEIYTFEQQRRRSGHAEPVISHRRFSDLEYAMLDHCLILSDYDVTESEIQAKTLNTTLAVVSELERQIQGEKNQLASTRTPTSLSQPRQLFLRFTSALFASDSTARLNTFNWCMGLLSRSGVLRTPRLNPRLEIWQRADYGRFFLPPPQSDQNPLTRSEEDDCSEISALSDLSNANQTATLSPCFPWRKKS